MLMEFNREISIVTFFFPRNLSTGVVLFCFVLFFIKKERIKKEQFASIKRQNEILLTPNWKEEKKYAGEGNRVSGRQR